jgi:hypothetical protein
MPQDVIAFRELTVSRLRVIRGKYRAPGPLAERRALRCPRPPLRSRALQMAKR